MRLRNVQDQLEKKVLWYGKKINGETEKYVRDEFEKDLKCETAKKV